MEWTLWLVAFALLVLLVVGPWVSTSKLRVLEVLVIRQQAALPCFQD